MMLLVGRDSQTTTRRDKMTPLDEQLAIPHPQIDRLYTVIPSSL
jgi:hypothetical protein